MKNVVMVLIVAIFSSLVYFAPDIRQHFGTRNASADREIFENSKPYIHGTIENIARLKLQYQLSDAPAHKQAIKQMVLTQVANFDRNQLPYELNNWVNSL